MENSLSGIRSAKTRAKYQRLATEFFDFLKLKALSQSSATRSQAKADSEWASRAMASFVASMRPRFDASEIKESTLYDYTKLVALFCFMNDIPVNWKKIGKGLPKVRP